MSPVFNPPDGLNRWALPIFILVLATIFSGAWFIRIPGIIKAEGQLTTSSDSACFAEIQLPEKNFARVGSGQTVRIHLYAYSATDYGLLLGTLQSISNLASDSGVSAIVRLPRPLVTSFGKTIPFRSGLKVEAEILNGNERLFNKILKTSVAGPAGR
ncbi:MAG TPA: hypothetical protein VIM64_05420 [Puia sp.]